MERVIPFQKRRYIHRSYRNPMVLLRKIFNIPPNEMILDFGWDKNENQLFIETICDYEKKEGDL
jgi:hypothetical protein